MPYTPWISQPGISGGDSNSANATFDIGTDLDSPVSLDYFEEAPFEFNGAIGTTRITYLKQEFAQDGRE